MPIILVFKLLTKNYNLKKIKIKLLPIIYIVQY